MSNKNTAKRNYNQHSESDAENSTDAANGVQQPAKKACGPAEVSRNTPEKIGDKPMFNDCDLDGLFDDDNFGLDIEALEDAEKFTLDLSKWQRCKIDSVIRDNRTITLIVSDKATGSKAKCVLEPPWTGLQFVEGATVSIISGFDKCAQVYRVSNQDGMIVTDPDYLVSGTSVVGALYCQRRGVLQERFRGVDKDSKLMTIGTIVHELLQRTLRNKVTDLTDIISLGHSYLESNEMAHMLYACNMTKAEAIKEIDPFYAKIHSFVTKHFVSQPAKKPFVPHSNDSQVQIHAIRDIEENIWCHQLGLKGKIDVTVEARCNSNNQQPQVMPLELKTGRASFSAEHKGQLVLYEMMMNLVGHKVENGILLYLREGKCAPVSGNRNMKRDLIMLRNEVAHFLSKSLPNTDSPDFDLSKDTLQLPEPLNNSHVCSRCPYAVICTAHLQCEDRQLPPDHSIKLISDESLSHLSNKHIDYFIRWAGLTYLEDQESRKSFKLKHIWTKSVEERHRMGRAFGNLSLSGRVIGSGTGSEYFHTFSVDALLPDGTQCQSAHDRLTSFFEPNQYLICSTSNRVAVAAGRVITVGKRDITMSFERDLSRHYADEQFTLDAYESNSNTTFNLTNLGVLLDNTERSGALRRIIVDREKPRFSRTISPEVATAAKEILHNLNKHQRVAVLSAVGTDSYCLFKGLPGTGKTQTVIALIRLLVAMGKSILITSNTHSAVDNVLRRLLPHGIKFLRLGASSRVDDALKEFTDGCVTEKCSTPEELAAVYDSYKIVGVTCLGAAHTMLVQRTFDYCIVDEATQVFQSAVIRPLLYADKFVLIGDPDQLPPVIRSHKARDLGADESLFFRLDVPESCCVLPTQYRMNKTITSLANDLSYQGKLTCANEAVAGATIKYSTAPAMQKKHKSEKWLLRAIASQQEMSVVLINTLNTYKSNLKIIAESKRDLGQLVREGTVEEDRRSAVYENYCEAAVILYTVMTMFEGGVSSNSIGIIAPFRAQVDLLRQQFQLLKKFYESQKDTKAQSVDVEINTVDQFQGRDKDVIFYSCTKSVDPALNQENKKASEYEVLEDHKRLTVAITRAKQKLIIVGDTDSLEKYTPFRNLFKHIHSSTKITLQDHAFGFEWSCVLNVLDALQDCADQ